MNHFSNNLHMNGERERGKSLEVFNIFKKEFCRHTCWILISSSHLTSNAYRTALSRWKKFFILCENVHNFRWFDDDYSNQTLLTNEILWMSGSSDEKVFSLIHGRPLKTYKFILLKCYHKILHYIPRSLFFFLWIAISIFSLPVPSFSYRPVEFEQ